MTKRQKTAKWLSFGGILLLCDLLQNTAGLFPEIGGARCFLLLPAAIILSMGEDERDGAFLGLFAGLLWDVSSGVHLGFNSIFIMVMCFFSCALVTYVARNTFITNMISSVVTVILYCLIYWLFFIIIKGVDGGEMTLFSFYIPCMIYTVAATPVLWLILRPVKRKFEYKEIPEI
ncbi:MAG: rod shape-determining protein MreD [Eubacteriales bacterium]|nr:rod shape-determining protein MreD [Eubacteriales bacterium]